MTEQELDSLPRTLTVDGQQFELIGTSGGRITYRNENGKVVSFEDRDVRQLIANSRQPRDLPEAAFDSFPAALDKG